MAEPQSEKTDMVDKFPPTIDRSSNEADEFYIDPAKEVKLLAKLDLAFVPIM
jgi:hypothetical protein